MVRVYVVEREGKIVGLFPDHMDALKFMDLTPKVQCIMMPWNIPSDIFESKKQPVNNPTVKGNHNVTI